MPPITYGIPLATVLYKFGFAGHLSGRRPGEPGAVGAVRDPDHDAVHRADRPGGSSARPGCAAPARWRSSCGSSRRCWCPGILASAILVLVRTVGMFELTFLTAGPDSQTLVVALYYSMSAAGIRAQQSVDAMAVIYTR